MHPNKTQEDRNKGNVKGGLHTGRKTTSFQGYQGAGGILVDG